MMDIDAPDKAISGVKTREVNPAALYTSVTACPT